MAVLHASAIDRILRQATAPLPHPSSSSSSSFSTTTTIPSSTSSSSSASSSLSILAKELHGLSVLTGLLADEEEQRRKEFFCLRRYIPFVVKLSTKVGENWLSLLSEQERKDCYDVFFTSKFEEGAGPTLLGLNAALKQSETSFTVMYHCNLIQSWVSSGGLTSLMRSLKRQQVADEQEEDVEQVLVSLPDRIGNKLDGKIPKFFHPKEYFPLLLAACLRFFEEEFVQEDDDDAKGLTDFSSCFAFAGSLFGKIAITGQSHLSASWLLRHLVSQEEEEEEAKLSQETTFSIVEEVNASQKIVAKTLNERKKRKSIIIARKIVSYLKVRHLDTFLHHLMSSSPNDLIKQHHNIREDKLNAIIVDLVGPLCFENDQVRDLLFRELMIHRVSLQRGCKERIFLLVLSCDLLERIYKDGTRKNLFAIARSLSELLASSSYTNKTDEDHQSRMCWLLVRCLHAMGDRAAIEEAEIVPFVLEAIQLRLAGHVEWTRQHGMLLAEQFSSIWSPEHAIKFEEEKPTSLQSKDASEQEQGGGRDKDEIVSLEQQPQSEIRAEETGKKTKSREKERRNQASGQSRARRRWQRCHDPDQIVLSSASESDSDAGSESGTDEEEPGPVAGRTSHLLDDSDSDSDDGLVPYEVEDSELENCFGRQAAVEQRDIANDMLPLRYGEGRVPLPSNLRQCLRGLSSQNPDEVEAAMFALPELVESSHMLEGEDYAEIARALLRLQDSFAMHDFAGRKRHGLLALTVADPTNVTQVFVKCVWGPNESVAARVDAIDVLADAAFQLSSLVKLPEPPVLEDSEILPSVGTTRRWSNKSKIKRRKPQENQFGRYAKGFFFGMLSGWNEQTSQRLLTVDVYVLGRMISSLGVFVECCGNSPDTPLLASGLLDLASSSNLRQHSEAYIRRCVFFALTRTLLTIPDQLFMHLFADRALTMQSWFEEALREESDLETVRLLRGGLALLSQKLASSLPKITVLDA